MNPIAQHRHSKQWQLLALLFALTFIIAPTFALACGSMSMEVQMDHSSHHQTGDESLPMGHCNSELPTDPFCEVDAPLDSLHLKSLSLEFDPPQLSFVPLPTFQKQITEQVGESPTVPLITTSPQTSLVHQHVVLRV